MCKVRLGAVLALGLLTAGFLAPLPASAATGADLATTVTPAFQQKTEFHSMPVYFSFTGQVTNDGPATASKVVVSVAGLLSFRRGSTVRFSVTPSETCTTSGVTFSCAQLPQKGTITASIRIAAFCLGHVCQGSVSDTASSVTPDPKPANNGRLRHLEGSLHTRQLRRII
jgi:hypothetical protein